MILKADLNFADTAAIMESWSRCRDNHLPLKTIIDKNDGNLPKFIESIIVGWL